MTTTTSTTSTTSATSATSATSTTTTSDVGAVRAVLQEIYAAWSAGDADAFAALYTEDATVTMRGVVQRGRAAVRDHMAAGFAGPLRGSQGVDTPQDVRIDGDTAIVVSRAGILFAGETELPADRAVLATWVLLRRDGRWRIAAYANTPAL
ncbi:SgcJ/EcaC family oxidoreductase [Jiangella endophytica]|uniref:SgcJ/EcaC family oxidoreductase n=1 Tax=Jiangella endophytica TaxID=1623398 RepID=UPI000E35683C|nr:SgcJ/EcaC family oxidoreductase [Jiangella endophytica]